MNKLGVVFLYIGLSQEWLTAKVKPTGYETVQERKPFIRLIANLYFDSSNILLFYYYIPRLVEYLMTCFFKYYILLEYSPLLVPDYYPLEIV